MDTLLSDHAATILGECMTVYRDWRGDTLCDAADVVQEAHIAVWTMRKRILGSNHVRGALRVVVRRAAVKFLRQQHRQLRRYAEIGVSNERREAPDMP